MIGSRSVCPNNFQCCSMIILDMGAVSAVIVEVFVGDSCRVENTIDVVQF